MANVKNRYKVSTRTNKDGSKLSTITVPDWVARVLPEGVYYEYELTDEGILLRPHAGRGQAVRLPRWCGMKAKG